MRRLEFINGQYITQKQNRPLAARIIPQAYFKTCLIQIVWTGASKAKRGFYGDAEWVGSSLDTLKALENIGIVATISGADNFSALDGPCVFIANHMSTLETFVLPGIVQPYKDVTFVVKQSLINYPVFGHIMRSRNPIVVGRSNPRDDLKTVLSEGAKRLASGISVIVFPQGTRSSSLDPADFNSIGIKLAKNAGVPIVPLALKTDAWGNGRFIKEFGKVQPDGRVYFEFSRPLRISGRGTEEHQAVIDFIRKKLAEWSVD